jgi:hypothetical protein
MHQVSLLGGLGSHPLRPDRVYATGVLSPMAGFRPGEAIMENAQRFTQGPYMGANLSGLGRPAWMAKMSAWWQGVKDRARAGSGGVAVRAQVPAVAAQPTITDPSGNATPGIPRGNAYGWHRQQHSIAPMAAYGENFGPASRLPHALTAQAYGQSPSLPGYAAEAAAKTTMMAWRGMRWPWG